MVAVGEESGELVAMLNHCSHYYESLLTQYIARMERLMEPILLTIMGVGIAILVISVMYPLFTSISSLGVNERRLFKMLMYCRELLIQLEHRFLDIFSLRRNATN